MNNFISRSISAAIIEAYKYFPVITVTGPRQSGKTTLLKHLFDSLPYYSLENLDVRNLAINDPVAFLKNAERGMILDEVQNVPQLLSYIQGIVDEDRDKRFILSGSSQFSMLHNVSQSLAGRAAIFELLPLSLAELTNDHIANVSLDRLLYKGFYPAVWTSEVPATMMYQNYVRTYLERDVRTLLGVKDLDLFQKFLRLCATRVGSVFVASQLAGEVGTSANTIKSWLSILQASYIVILLQPFYENTRKRLTKSPKLYFNDTGLAAYLLEIDSPEQLRRDKMRGHLFENLIVAEALKSRLNRGKDNNLCFYRDSHNNEVDLILREQGLLKLIEIKSAETYHSDFEKGIKCFDKDFSSKVKDRAIIYAGELENRAGDIKLLNYKNLGNFV